MAFTAMESISHETAATHFKILSLLWPASALPCQTVSNLIELLLYSREQNQQISSSSKHSHLPFLTSGPVNTITQRKRFCAGLC